MLKQLQLTNFRQHRNVTVDFGPGMQVIRAPNEGGKTTLIEAALYAMYGSRVLRTSVDDCVTWGENPRTLKAEATLEIGGEEFTFIRSKAGAEVHKDGQVYVTGQTEVTNFATKLLGADAATASNLMLASQANMRGALEQGPKATAELVEGLAEFDFFDHLLDRMQERLPLGSDVSARQRLEEAEQALETLTDEKVDTSQWEELVEKAPAVLEQLQELVDTKLQPTYDAARQAWDQAKNNRSTYDLLKNNLAKAQSNLDDARTQHIAAQTRAEKEVDTSVIKDLQAQLDDIQNLENQRQVFAALRKLNATYPAAYWEGDSASLQAEIEKTETEIETLNSQLADNKHQTATLRQEIIALQKQFQKDDHCSACGQLLQDHEEISKRNNELAKQIADLHIRVINLGPEHDELDEQLEERKSDLADLKGVFASASPFDDFIRSNAQHVEVDTNFVPPKITWKGREPHTSVYDPSEIRKQISDIEAADKSVREARAKVAALADTISQYEAQVADFEKQVASYDVVNVQEYQDAKDDAYSELLQTQGQMQRLRDEVQEAKTQIQLAKQTFEQQQARREEALKRIEACKKEIADLGFNNALIRKVRASRGPVTDKLWAMVLMAVSTMFTQMRGEESVVTKGKDGFLVNGQTVASLSGSTLDILGLAIRVALTKTFLPGVGMLWLDEPAAACSDERTEQMLGFLKTTGFSQTILITHEDISEAVADNLITL